SSGVEVLSSMLTNSSIGPVTWRDNWFPFLWLALAYAAFRRDRLVGALLVPYLVVMVAVVDQNAPRVWYREPLFPALCLAGAVFLRDAWGRPDPIKAALVVFGLALGKLADGYKASELIGPRLVPVLVLLLAVPFLLRLKPLVRWEVGAAIVAALIG